MPITAPCDRPLIWRYLINKRIIIASALAAVATTAMILAHKEIAMVKMESTVTIARPVEEVFRFFLDLDRNAQKLTRTSNRSPTHRKSPQGLEPRFSFVRGRSER